MDEAVKHLEEVITKMESKIDTLTWKMKKFERVLLSESDKHISFKVMSMMTNLAETCRKYDDVLILIAEHRNEQIAFTDTLQLQVNLVKSKVETLQALITKGRTIEF